MKLQFGYIAVQLGLSFSNMARATRLSRTTLFKLASYGVWPARTDAANLQAALRALFAKHGATAAQQQTMFDEDTREGRIPSRGRFREARTPEEGPVARTPHNFYFDPKKRPQVTDMLLPRQSLTPAARKAFALFRNPFASDVANPAELFENSETRYVREVCWQAATNASFVAIVGESGAGKTTILDDLKTRIDTDRRSVVLIEPSVMGMEDTNQQGKTLKSADIQCAMVMTLDPLVSVAHTPEKRARQMKELLVQRTRSGDLHLLIIEEAHCLPIPTLKHLKRLHESMRMGLRPMLGILLVAQPELEKKLQRYDTREVAQRCELVTLRPLDGDLRAYLDHRAQITGRRLAEFIDDGGVDELRARLTWAQDDKRTAPISLAYPLAVNNLMTACLNVAAEIGAPLVTKEIVRAA